MNKTTEMMAGTHKRHQIPEVQMPIYTLSYTDECGTDHEVEREFWTDKAAMDWAYSQANGNEGLWTGVSLYRGEDEILPANECWW